MWLRALEMNEMVWIVATRGIHARARAHTHTHTRPFPTLSNTWRSMCGNAPAVSALPVTSAQHERRIGRRKTHVGLKHGLACFHHILTLKRLKDLQRSSQHTWGSAMLWTPPNLLQTISITSTSNAETTSAQTASECAPSSHMTARHVWTCSAFMNCS